MKSPFFHCYSNEMIEQIATVQICRGPPTLPTFSGRYLLGLFFIFAQCFAWIAASVLTQFMFDETVVESPFLMTYVGVVLCVVMFPVKWTHDWWKDRQELLVEESADTIPKDEDSFDEALNNATAYQDIVEVMTTRSVSMGRSKRPWNHKKHALAALQ